MSIWTSIDLGIWRYMPPPLPYNNSLIKHQEPHKCLTTDQTPVYVHPMCICTQACNSMHAVGIYSTRPSDCPGCPAVRLSGHLHAKYTITALQQSLSRSPPCHSWISRLGQSLLLAAIIPVLCMLSISPAETDRGPCCHQLRKGVAASQVPFAGPLCQKLW